ncbi:hypothetical protein WJX77_012152 [Trebouxia sp. C0004]
MVCALERDCDAGDVAQLLQFENIDWFPSDHTATATGWEAGLALYKDSHRLQRTQDASERCSALAKLVQAFVACPSAAESMFEASPPWQLFAYEAGSSSSDALLLQLLALCAGLLRRVSETNVQVTSAADPAAELIYILKSFHIPLLLQFLTAQSTLPAFRKKTEALGIQCQDIEWFSRAAMLKITLQMCTKQGFMPADVLSEATRHAERLVELAPGNPASHEIRSYVHMHDAQQDLDAACRSMQAAMYVAEAAKDDVGVSLYAQQVMYFMLWDFNGSQNKTRSALSSLEMSVRGVLHSVKEAEEHIREARAPESVCDAVQSMASSRLTAAKRRLSALAYTLSGTPQALLDYLQPYRPQARNSQPQHTAPVRPSCSQLAHSSRRSVKLGLRLPSMLKRRSLAQRQRSHGMSSSISVPASAAHKTSSNSDMTTNKVTVSTAGTSSRSANTRLSCKTAIRTKRVSSQTSKPAEACTADRVLYPGRAACTGKASQPSKASVLTNTGGDPARTASTAMVADAGCAACTEHGVSAPAKPLLCVDDVSLAPTAAKGQQSSWNDSGSQALGASDDPDFSRSASSSSSIASMFSASSCWDAPFWFMPEPDELCRDADRSSCTATAADTSNTTLPKHA